MVVVTRADNSSLVGANVAFVQTVANKFRWSYKKDVSSAVYRLTLTGLKSQPGLEFPMQSGSKILNIQVWSFAFIGSKYVVQG